MIDIGIITGSGIYELPGDPEPHVILLANSPAQMHNVLHTRSPAPSGGSREHVLASLLSRSGP